MCMIERLPAIVQIEICEYLDGADIVNICEAMPNMKSILKYLAIKSILRNYVRHMEWVDATLCRMLYHTFAVTDDAEDESMAKADSEVEVLCKAIRYYGQKCQSCTKYVAQNPPNPNSVLYFLVLGSGISISEIVIPFSETLGEWTDERGRRLYKNCFTYNGLSKTVPSISGFDSHTDISNLDEEESEQRYVVLDTHAIRQFRFVMYVMDSAVQCHSRRRLPYVLKRLMTIIGRITSGVTSHPPLLLILDANSEQVRRTAVKCDHFECLVTSLYKLDDGTFGGGDAGSPVSVGPCNWWRVWRLRWRGGLCVSMHDAFRWALSQLTNTNAEGSGQLHSKQPDENGLARSRGGGLE